MPKTNRSWVGSGACVGSGAWVGAGGCCGGGGWVGGGGRRRRACRQNQGQDSQHSYNRIHLLRAKHACSSLKVVIQIERHNASLSRIPRSFTSSTSAAICYLFRGR